MNVEIGTEAALFPEKEYINGIFLAVYSWVKGNWSFFDVKLWLCLKDLDSTPSTCGHTYCKKKKTMDLWGDGPFLERSGAQTLCGGDGHVGHKRHEDVVRLDHLKTESQSN